MKKSHFYLPILIFLFGCQVYMDPRNEPLMLVTEEEWSELKTVKETNFEIEQDFIDRIPQNKISKQEQILMMLLYFLHNTEIE